MLLVMACIWGLIQQVNVKHFTTGFAFLTDEYCWLGEPGCAF
jgi:hypothetical protein